MRGSGIIVAALMLCASAAQAETESPKPVAEALFQQAREEMSRGDYESARRKLAESQRLDPSAGTLLNLVICEERLGKVAIAWAHARELADQLPPSDERKAIADEMVAALAKRVSYIRISLAAESPGETRVALDGIELHPSSLGVALPVDPGQHTIAVSAPGRPDRTTTSSVEPRQTAELEVAPAALPKERTTVPVVRREGAGSKGRRAHVPPVGQSARSAAPANKPVASPRESDTAGGEASGGTRLLGWSVVGVGLAGLALGTVTGVMMLGKKSEVDELCPDGMCSDNSGLEAASEGRTLMVWTVGSLAVGAAGIGVGTYLLLNSDDDGRAGSPSRKLTASRGALFTWVAAF